MKYKVIAPVAKIRRHLMPRPPIVGKLLQGAEFEGELFGEWVHVTEPTRSGFVLKSLVLEMPEEPSHD